MYFYRMPTSPASQSRLTLYLSMAGITLLLLVLILEGMLRLVGYKGYEAKMVPIHLEGGDRFFVPDSLYGYAVQEGSFRITQANQLTFEVNHDSSRHRICALPSPSDTLSKPEIWILGCSFTHGWGVNDDEAWPWRLQHQFPDYRVINFATSGYGNLHSCLQLNNALSAGHKPELVILAYAGFHDQRNTANGFWMKTLSTFGVLGEYGYPYARWHGDTLVTATKPIGYAGLPGMHRSALMHFLDNLKNYAEDHSLASHKVSQHLIGEINELSQEAGANFLLAGITQDPATSDMLTFFESQAVPVVDMAVDLTDPALSFLPVDPHPNPAAHLLYAKVISGKLVQMGYMHE